MLRNSPRLWVLDEPACGVDIQSRRYLWTFLRNPEHRKGLGFLTTHLMEEAEELCDQGIILREGKLVAYGSITYIRRELGGGYRVETPTLTEEQLRGIIGKLGEVYKNSSEKVTARITSQNTDELISLLKTLRSQGHDFHICCPSLTEAFIRVCECPPETPLIE